MVTFFLFKVASEGQIKEIVVKCKEMELGPAEVEKLFNERNDDGSYNFRLKGTSPAEDNNLLFT